MYNNATRRLRASDVGNFEGSVTLILRKIRGPGDTNEGACYQNIVFATLGFLRHFITPYYQ